MILPEKIHYIEIFPPIGIARVGNSLDEFYIGSEIPRSIDLPPSGYKDAQGAVKREAARFRAYGYDAEGAIVGELNHRTGYHLQWIVKVANSKGASKVFRRRYEDIVVGLRNPNVQGNISPSERSKLIVSATQTISGIGKTSEPLEGEFFGSRKDPTKVYLGELQTDEAGRLIFLGGRGESRSVANPHVPQPMIEAEFDNMDWVDDTCDGTVELTVTHIESKEEMPTPKFKSWVICGPPKFARGARSPTTLYDVIEEIYEQRKRTQEGYEVEKPSFYYQIWDIFECTWILSWLNNFARAHGPHGLGYNFMDHESKLALKPKGGSEPDLHKRERRKVFQFIRMPLSHKYEKQRKAQCMEIYMPRLSGESWDIPELHRPAEEKPIDPNRFLSLTELQFDRLEKWMKGDFETGVKTSPPDSLEDIPLAEQPGALTRAALEWCIGAPLCPGIEVHWTAALPDTYDFEVELKPGMKLDPPFRIAKHVKPGDLTQTLAVPWQSDFYQCNTHWWPSTRPDDVVPEAHFNEVYKRYASHPMRIPSALSKRHLWARDLRNTHEDGDHSKYTGPLDMVLYWNQLGFVYPRQYGDPATDLPLVLVEEPPGYIPPRETRPV
ncbi:hypothetical protein FRC02_010753 [Tulasnella sp. 418]|nr:hypothetical protein FRC02_010753 [Tulasnella sp. 418]